MYDIQSLRAQHPGDSFQTQINRAGCGFFRGEMRRFAAFPPLSLKRERAKKLHDWGFLSPAGSCSCRSLAAFFLSCKDLPFFKKKGNKETLRLGVTFSRWFLPLPRTGGFFLTCKDLPFFKKKGNKETSQLGFVSPAGSCLCRRPAGFFLPAKTSLSLERKGKKKLCVWGLLSPAGFCLCRRQFLRSPNKKE